MAISSVGRLGRLYSICGVLFLLLAGPLHASQTTITIGGSEQYALPATWDGGSLSLTVNGHTETVGYGQFSTVQSVASGLAAKFSLDCTSPVVALASGATITFTTRHPDEGFEQISASAVWNTAAFTRASFGIPQSAATTTATLTPSLMLACTPDPVPAGGSADCTAHLFQGVTGTVSFSLDGQTSWSTATVDGNGWAPASALTGLQPGSHTLTASYSGDNTYNATTQTLAMQVDSGALASASVYSYSITSYDPDSNILGYTDQVNGSWSSIQYDNLNRLTGATATPVSGTAQNWCWSYDSFGNRTLEATSAGSVACTNSGTGNQTVPTANNQIAGLVYDAAGNVTFDGNNSYAYDGDGRMCAMATHPPSGGTIAFQYIYDADGNRVAKGTIQLISVNGVQTLSCDTTQNSFTPTSSYILGQNDEVVTEMTVVGGQSVWAHTNAWAGGMLLATYDPQGLHFHLTDWLGSRRVQTNAFGQVEETCVNSPFGNGLNCSYPSSAPTTADDATEHHFTGKERDAESGLDNFEARYFASMMGRFISPDPSGLTYADLSNPQSFNLYSYVRNNPLINTDPTGLDCVHINNDTGAYEGFESGDCDNSTEEKANSGYYVDGTIKQISMNSQGQVLGYSTSTADGYFPGTPGASSTDGTAANLNPYTGAVSNPNQSTTVSGSSDSESVIPRSASDYVPLQQSLGDRVDAWITRITPSLLSAGCFIVPGTINETEDAVNQLKGKPRQPSSGNTDTGGPSNTYARVPRAPNGYMPVGNQSGDAKASAGANAVQYVINSGTCLQNHH